MMDFIKLNGLTKIYRDNGERRIVFKNINQTIQKGSIVGVMGESGAGKSSLLRIIAGVDEDYIGQVIYGDSENDMDYLRRYHIGYIPQQAELISFLTIYENILLGNSTQERKRTNDLRDRVEVIASRLRIDKLLDRFPHQISGGERQRCVCARALIKDPRLIVADEPTSALDKENEAIVMNSLKTIKKESGIVVVATHNINLLSYLDCVTYLEDGDIKFQMEKSEFTSKAEYRQALLSKVYEDLNFEEKCIAENNK